jgi:glycosyltransferase involved in cell wall biosynthesis
MPNTNVNPGIETSSERGPPGTVTVLLIANYLPDKQKSMTRVAELLESGLCSAGIRVRVIQPTVLFGGWIENAGGLGKWIGYLDKFLLFPFKLFSALTGVDLVHVVDHSNAVYLYWLGRRKSVVTCNDLLAVRSGLGEFAENRTGFTGKIFQRWILGGLTRAKHVVCISDATKRDLLRLTQKREADVSQTYLALGEAFRIALQSNLKETLGTAIGQVNGSAAGRTKKLYILHVGGDTWYKNRLGVLEIYCEIRTKLGQKAPALVMVGPPLETSGAEVTFLQDLDDTELAALYASAELLLFPSLEEGFGWPVVEAQACGCPVVTTGKPPMTEAGGTAAIYLRDPCDAKSAAETVIAVLQYDSATRARIRDEGFQNAQRFTEPAMIAGYLQVYRSLLIA